MKTKILVLFLGLFSTQVVAGIFDRQCDDTIYTSGKNIHVSYHNNSWSWGKCKKSSDKKHWLIPHIRGKSCADSRVDGCSYDLAKIALSERDKKLITPSCNEHDLCYSTKGNVKKDCDDDFKKNLKKTKKNFQAEFDVDVIYDAVVLFEKSAYEDGQKWGKTNKCKK